MGSTQTMRTEIVIVKSQDERRHAAHVVAFRKAEDFLKMFVNLEQNELRTNGSIIALIHLWFVAQNSHYHPQVMTDIMQTICQLLIQHKGLELSKKLVWLKYVFDAMTFLAIQKAIIIKNNLLAVAAYEGCESLVDWILKNGAHIESEAQPFYISPDEGFRATPLYWAMRRGHESVIIILRAQHARDPKIE